MSFSLENRHLEMHLLSGPDINIYYLTHGPMDDSAVQRFTAPSFPSFGVFCVEREKPGGEK